jgi:hypothetical protein
LFLQPVPLPRSRHAADTQYSRGNPDFHATNCALAGCLKLRSTREILEMTSQNQDKPGQDKPGQPKPGQQNQNPSQKPGQQQGGGQQGGQKPGQQQQNPNR